MSSRCFELGAGIQADWTSDYLHLGFAEEQWALTSCVLNGGLRPIRHLLNLRVTGDASVPLPPPDVTLQDFAARQGWMGTCAGMMTAASMNSLRVAQWQEQGVRLTALVTTGLANARCAGDRAEWRRMAASPDCLGTINLILLSSVRFSEAAMVEAVMLATEAKVHAVRRCGVRSPVSGEFATGTGTDSVALICGRSDPLVGYCGKHVLVGERLAGLVQRVIEDSLGWRAQGNLR